MKLYQVSYNNGISYEYVYVLANNLDRAIIAFRNNFSYEIVSINEALESDAKFLVDNGLEPLNK